MSALSVCQIVAKYVGWDPWNVFLRNPVNCPLPPPHPHPLAPSIPQASGSQEGRAVMVQTSVLHGHQGVGFRFHWNMAWTQTKWVQVLGIETRILVVQTRLRETKSLDYRLKKHLSQDRALYVMQEFVCVCETQMARCFCEPGCYN